MPLALAGLFIWLTYNKLTPQDLEQLERSFREADYTYVVLGMFLAFFSHLSRAFRWRLMLEPLGYRPTARVLISCIGVGYLMNLVIPRSGEVSRAVIAHNQSGVPVPQAIGTIVTERVIDFVLLLGLIALTVILQYDVIMDVISKNGQGIPSLGWLGVLAAVGMAGLIWVLKSQNRFALKIKTFLIGLKEGILAVRKMQKPWLYVAHTIFIWGMYLLMFWVVFYSLPETANTPLTGVLTAFITGSLSIAFTNGGLGSYPFFVATVLVYFGVVFSAGTAFGWIVWASQTLMILIYGGISFLALRSGKTVA